MYTLIRNFIIAFVLTFVFLPVGAQTKPTIYKKARIEWQKIDGASAYEVEIRKNGFVILKQRTQQNYVEANLTHGVYKFRLSVYDHKGVLANRTGWNTLIVRKWSLVEKKYQYAAIGWGYSTLVPEWHTILQNSNKNIHLYYAYDLPWNGFAAEGLIEYEDFDPEGSSSNTVSTNMNLWTFAPGVCLFAQMNQYVDVTMHLNVGLALSNLEVLDRDETTNYTSYDPLTLFGIGVRGAYQYGFIEHGIYLKSVFYQGSTLNEFKPFIRIGARF